MKTIYLLFIMLLSLATVSAGTQGNNTTVTTAGFIPSASISEVQDVSLAFNLGATFSYVSDDESRILNQGFLPAVTSVEETSGDTETASTPPWDYTITEFNHSILIETGAWGAISLFEGVDSVYLGTMYDSSGVEACAGFKKVSTTGWGAVPAMGADAGEMNGYAAGEALKFKAWYDSKEHKLDALITAGPTVYTPNALTTISSFTLNDEITIDQNQAPYISKRPKGLAVVDNSYFSEVQATDNDGEEVTITINSGMPDFLSATESPGKVVFEGIPQLTDTGSYTIYLTLTDGDTAVSENVNILVITMEQMIQVDTTPNIHTFKASKDVIINIEGQPASGEFLLKFPCDTTGNECICGFGLIQSGNLGTITCFGKTATQNGFTEGNPVFPILMNLTNGELYNTEVKFNNYINQDNNYQTGGVSEIVRIDAERATLEISNIDSAVIWYKNQHQLLMFEGNYQGYVDIVLLENGNVVDTCAKDFKNIDDTYQLFLEESLVNGENYQIEIRRSDNGLILSLSDPFTITEEHFPIFKSQNVARVLLTNDLDLTYNGENLYEAVVVAFTGEHKNPKIVGQKLFSGENSFLYVYGFDPATPEEPGLVTGEIFKLGVYFPQTGSMYQGLAEFEVSGTYPDIDTFKINGQSKLVKLDIRTQQVITIDKGTNVISRNRGSNALSTDAVFTNSDVLYAEDINRSVFSQSLSIHEFKYWEITQSVIVFAEESTSIAIDEEMIVPGDHPISLTGNMWNWPAYLSYESQSTENVFQEIEQEMFIAINQEGKYYYPDAFDGTVISNWDSISPGDGMFIYMFQDAVLTNNYNAGNSKSGGKTREVLQPVHFASSQDFNTGNPMIFIFSHNSLADEMEEGDEIAIVSADGTVLNSAVKTSGSIVIPIAGDNSYTTKREGPVDGDKMKIKLWSKSTHKESFADISFKKGSDHFTSFGISIAGDLTGISEITEKPFTIYPNPASDYIILENKTDEFKLQFELVSPTGQILYSKMLLGTMNRIDIPSYLPRGVYILRVTGNDTVSIAKWVLQ